jgi:hypothetical protein
LAKLNFASPASQQLCPSASTSNPCPTRCVRHAVTDVSAPAPALTALNRNRSDPRKALGENSPHPQMSRLGVRLFRGFLRGCQDLRSSQVKAVFCCHPLSPLVIVFAE